MAPPDEIAIGHGRIALRKMTMIEKIEDPAAFRALRNEWDDLLEASSANSFFLTWEWLYPWWKHLSGDRKLSILTARASGELIAIAPLAWRRQRIARIWPFPSLEFLGTDRICSDYLDVIVRRGKEDEALRALGEYLARETLLLELADVKRSRSMAVELAAALETRGWSRTEAETDTCPFITLAGHSWESYLATLGAEHRYNFRRRLRNLTQRSTVRFQQAHSPSQRREALALLVALHNMRWRDRGPSDAFNAPDLLSFHDEVSQLALDRGWLRLFTLTIDGRPAASVYGFCYDHTFYFFQSGFDPAFSKQSVGLLSMGLAIRSAIESGAAEFDLLRGGEPYKFHWARESRELGRLELYPPRGRALLYKQARVVSRAAKTMAQGFRQDRERSIHSDHEFDRGSRP